MGLHGWASRWSRRASALRRAGIEAPILVLSEFPAGTERAALDAHLTPSLYTRAGLHRLHDAAAGRASAST